MNIKVPAHANQSHRFYFYWVIFCWCLFSVKPVFASTEVDKYFELYLAAKFEATVAAFDSAIQTKDNNINKEALIDILESSFSQLQQPSTDLLREKLMLALKAKTQFFLKKRIRATLKAIDLFDAHKTHSLSGLHDVIQQIAELPSGALTYPHTKFAKLRVMRMVLNQRRIKGVAQAGDHFLHAIIDHQISKSGDEQLSQYFKRADKTDIFYEHALALKAKYP